MTAITRNRAQGTLLLNGAHATLRGGNYSLFLTPGVVEEAIVKLGTQDPIIVVYRGVDPVQDEANRAIPAALATWAESGNTFPEFFAAMQSNRCNLVRLFMTGGTVAGRTLQPFNSTVVDGRIRYDVRGAVLNGRWNEAYFARLRAFVAAADLAGVVVQLSLFNYFDLEDDDNANPVKRWGLTPWRAANSLDAAWGSAHLVPELARVDRHAFFITPAAGSGLRAVQQELIGRTVKTLAGLNNVILEVMNEPRAQDINRLVEFDSYMTGLIMRYRTTFASKALISINASRAAAQGPLDVDVWKTSGRPNFGEIDLVSYHGLTGFAPVQEVTSDGSPVTAYRVDGASVAERARLHFGTHPLKPMMYSSDAVRIGKFEHTYNNRQLRMHVRDGQIRVTPGLNQENFAYSERLHTRVLHWASRSFEQARLRPGQVHFHNHSTFRQSLVQIGQASSTIQVAGIAESAPAESVPAEAMV